MDTGSKTHRHRMAAAMGAIPQTMPMEAKKLCDGFFERGRRLQLRRLIVHEVAIHQLEQSLPETSLRGASDRAARLCSLDGVVIGRCDLSLQSGSHALAG